MYYTNNNPDTVTWCEYPNSYLGGYSSGTYSYNNDLASAQAACLERDDCGGITQEPNRYTLRSGSELKVSPSGETSWTVCEEDEDEKDGDEKDGDEGNN